jgi:hypothetical protein
MQPNTHTRGPGHLIVETVIVEAKPIDTEASKPPGQRSGQGADSVLNLMLKDAAARSPGYGADTHPK